MFDELQAVHRSFGGEELQDDLSKLRAKRLVEKVDHARRYRLLPHGYRLCVAFLKLFERVYAADRGTAPADRV